MTNLCRDEVTAALKLKIEDIFGSSFNTNGLGGVLTCGVTGVKAGLSHSPLAKVRHVLQAYPYLKGDAWFASHLCCPDGHRDLLMLCTGLAAPHSAKSFAPAYDWGHRVCTCTSSVIT